MAQDTYLEDDEIGELTADGATRLAVKTVSLYRIQDALEQMTRLPQNERNIRGWVKDSCGLPPSGASFQLNMTDTPSWKAPPKTRYINEVLADVREDSALIRVYFSEFDVRVINENPT